VKPSRGKRRGPYRPTAGFSPQARRGRSAAHLLAGALRASRRRAAAVLSAAGAPRPVRRRRETPGQGDRRLGVGTYRPGERRPVGGPRTTVATARRPPVVRERSTRGDRFRCPRTARAYRPDGAARRLGSVADRPATCPTRLETRTKESNMCASRWALRNPKAQ
jgi:hypothetical protein